MKTTIQVTTLYASLLDAEGPVVRATWTGRKVPYEEYKKLFVEGRKLGMMIDLCYETCQISAEDAAKYTDLGDVETMAKKFRATLDGIEAVRVEAATRFEGSHEE